MRPEPGIGTDTIEREIESVLKSRTFIRDGACFSSVNGLEAVAAKVAALIALANFARAKLCFERAGLGVEWESTVRLLFSRHHRKTGFMSGFRAVAEGSFPEEPSSSLERAKRLWRGRYGSTMS
jgi:hypothetical protein